MHTGIIADFAPVYNTQWVAGLHHSTKFGGNLSWYVITFYRS